MNRPWMVLNFYILGLKQKNDSLIVVSNAFYNSW